VLHLSRTGTADGPIFGSPASVLYVMLLFPHVEAASKWVVMTTDNAGMMVVVVFIASSYYGGQFSCLTDINLTIGHE